MQYDDDDRPAKDWILRTDYGLDGDSLSYEDRLCCEDAVRIRTGFQNHFHDRMERKELEEERRAKERQLMEEGR